MFWKYYDYLVWIFIKIYKKKYLSLKITVINNTIVYYDNVSSEDINNLISNLTDDELSSFRYYNKRSISSCLEKHCKTIIVKDKNIPIGYGHLEYEDNKLWLGIVVKNLIKKKESVKLLFKNC